MKILVILVAVIAAVAAAGEKENKLFAYNRINPWNQGYYPGNLGYHPGYQGFTGYRGFYPGFHGNLGYQGYYPGYVGYKGYYPGYQGYNRGYYPGFEPSLTPIIATATPLPKAIPTQIAIAAPAYKPVEGRQPAILRQSQEASLDGTFSYGYETENGISNQAQGYVKNAGTDAASQVVEGSYSYTADDGSPVEVRYYADESGYHAEGNVVPTIPAEIAKSLEFNAHEEAAKLSAIKK
ncbi:larval cuticle protein LCP-22-like [Daktulosphaira vitifoliae]|uniref:larval cuticle protein LCP-22-like n=1 Tax=Daktulosphaira vitifoliae TaxID=58002 RepID=UPI0021A9A1DC|nr:larval cuticle protein LCP-22-like [Daktulosphaira vitifoliae]